MYIYSGRYVQWFILCINEQLNHTVETSPEINCLSSGRNGQSQMHGIQTDLFQLSPSVFANSTECPGHHCYNNNLPSGVQVRYTKSWPPLLQLQPPQWGPDTVQRILATIATATTSPVGSRYSTQSPGHHCYNNNLPSGVQVRYRESWTPLGWLLL
jgi:hypothetical protein